MGVFPVGQVETVLLSSWADGEWSTGCRPGGGAGGGSGLSLPGSRDPGELSCDSRKLSCDLNKLSVEGCVTPSTTVQGTETKYKG